VSFDTGQEGHHEFGEGGQSVFEAPEHTAIAGFTFWTHAHNAEGGVNWIIDSGPHFEEALAWECGFAHGCINQGSRESESTSLEARPLDGRWRRLANISTDQGRFSGDIVLAGRSTYAVRATVVPLHGDPYLTGRSRTLTVTIP
jgi:hypothetical protein